MEILQYNYIYYKSRQLMEKWIIIALICNGRETDLMLKIPLDLHMPDTAQ